MNDARSALASAAASRVTVLPYGCGRSYGDSCLNPGGVLLDTANLDCVIAFDREQGHFRAEPGITLDQILRIVVPHGWFLPVTPGTKFVSLGGAIANDVHGKNHHQAGSFGHHVRALGLLTSDGAEHELRPGDAALAATIGGLGLTGFIHWAEIQLERIESAWLTVENIRFEGLDRFFRLSAESAHEWAHTVAWIDSVNLRGGQVRGIFSRGRFAADANLAVHRKGSRVSVPFQLPAPTLNRLSVAAFNRLFDAKTRAGATSVHYDPFFYPLDGVGGWNRIYGPDGLYQYQCVVPAGASAVVEELMQRIVASGQASFLSVLKQFGDRPPVGIMSFPMAGTTLALDFRNRGSRTLALFEDLDELVLAAGGRVYPAKDGRLSSATFQAMYPQWRDFAGFVDPVCSSAFWRRVTDQQPR